MNEARSLPVSAGPILEALEARLLLDATTAQQAIELFHTTPAVFIENQGQWADESVRFVHKGQGANIAHTDSGPVFELFREVPAPEDDTESRKKGPDTFSEQPRELERLRFSATFDGANAVVPVGLVEAQTRFNFLLGDPSQWRENVPSYQVVAYEGLYDGIDLHTWGRRDHLKYDFHVAAGTDFSQIRVSYSGIDALSIDEAGALHVRLPGDWGEVVDAAPYIYQLVGGEQVEVPGVYRLVDGDTYAFEITGGYDPTRPLVIDPDLAWSSYLGGSSDESGNGIAIDAAGNVLVTGGTSSFLWFPWVWGGWDMTYGGGDSDAFVVKLSPSGGHLWSTYMGGSDSDRGDGIAADAPGNVLVTGTTYSSGWVSGGWDTGLGGGADAFVVKLSATGGHLWSSYLGGMDFDGGNGIAADAAGNALVTGYTKSADWVWGGWDTSFNGGSYDGFVVKLSASGGHLWSSYLGGSDWDWGEGIAADAAGNALVTGYTESGGWVSGGWDTSFNGSIDAFVVKLSASGGHLWSTYLGGSNWDRGYGIAADAAGNALVTGCTNCSWVWGGWDTSLNGYFDGFVVKLRASGGHLWSSYLGGGSDDEGYGIAVDAAGNALVTGYTESGGWVSGGWDTTLGGNTDGFVAKIEIDDASDFGDAPSPYPTTSGSDGAWHFATGPTLGAERDTEPDGQPTAAADGDDAAGTPDDEDGVTFGSTIRVGQLDASVTAYVSNAPAGARLDAWIDFNADGTWGGAFEQIADNLAVSEGDNTITFDVPSWAVDGSTYARFRLSTAGDLAPDGAAADGEVEDYRVTIASPAASDGVFGQERAISTAANGALSVFAADVDGDGDMDVLSASYFDHKIAWYENDGAEGFTAHTISRAANGARSVFAADVDGDGDMDVLSASMNDDKIAWYENDGSGGFTPHTISTAADGARSVFAADVDADGDLDVLSASPNDDKIAWYENDGAEGFTAHTISTAANGAYSVFAADVDGDGDMDVLSASSIDDKIAWYENDGSEGFTERAISADADGACSVFAADVDGDGCLDVLSASNGDDKIAWYENDGSGGFTAHTISTAANEAHSVFAADVDGDGDMDVLSASMNGDKIAWYENDGSGGFTAHTISTAANGAYSVFAADVDADGDLDVLSASINDDKIAWYENDPDTDPPTVEAWYSAAVHGHGVGEAVLQIPDTGDFSEPRVLGVSKLRLEFSEAIAPASFTAASVRMAGNDTDGNPVDLTGVVVTASAPGDHTVGIIQFAPAMPDEVRYAVRIEGVTDVAGNPLAGDADRIFTALAGDATGDLRVNAIDLSYIWPRRTTLIDGVSEDQTRSDVTCDGRVNAIDLSAAWPRRGADMQDVADPVLGGKLGGAATSADALAEAAAWAVASRDDGADAPAAVPDGTAPPPAARVPADMPTALPARPAASAGVVTVPLETAAFEVGADAPAAAVGAALPDVLSLANLVGL